MVSVREGPSPLKREVITPGGAIIGDIKVEVPKYSANLIFMYAGLNDSFLARVS